ncbi:PAAR-like domain-containing protein [Cystobacter ferrugineus]|uniref:PAAR-like domain-containing protein n=1 Tax=Cystobacter ferrugineus TaxID=83449 RepID=UPI000A4A6BB8|nr:PAAR-like domain-containing protein [Cystobacter ferrugineus]
MSKTFANGRTIVHKGDGRTNVSAAPDVCKTPSPGGPVPVPYVNLAKDSDLSEGSTTVELEGHLVALKGSALGTSTGGRGRNGGRGTHLLQDEGKDDLGHLQPGREVRGLGGGALHGRHPAQWEHLQHGVPTRRRASLELMLRSGRPFDFEPDWPVRRQREALACWHIERL